MLASLAHLELAGSQVPSLPWDSPHRGRPPSVTVILRLGTLMFEKTVLRGRNRDAQVPVLSERIEISCQVCISISTTEYPKTLESNVSAS